MEERKQNEFFKQTAEELIRTEPALFYIKDCEAKIIYLESDFKKTSSGKIVFGECEKIRDKYRWAIDADFTITLYMPNLDAYGFDKDRIKILLFHELLHVGVDVTQKGEFVFKVKPHDIEDFKYILDRFGLEWQNDGEFIIP